MPINMYYDSGKEVYGLFQGCERKPLSAIAIRVKVAREGARGGSQERQRGDAAFKEAARIGYRRTRDGYRSDRMAGGAARNLVDDLPERSRRTVATELKALFWHV